MEPIHIVAQLTELDWQALQRARTERVFHEGWSLARIIRVTLITLLGAGLWFVNSMSAEPFSIDAVLCGMALGLLLWRFSWQALAARVSPDRHGLFPTEHRFELSAAGVHSAQAGVLFHTEWSAVKALSATQDHCFIWLDRMHALVIPLRELPRQLSRVDLQQALQGWSGQPFECSGENRLRSPLAADQTEQRWWSSLARLLTLRSPSALPQAADASVLSTLALLTLLVWVAGDWLRSQPQAYFYPYNLPDLAWYALALLAMATLVGFMSNPPLALARTLSLLLAPAPCGIAAYCLIDSQIDRPGLRLVALAALALYLLAYLRNALRALSGRLELRVLLAVLALTAGAAWSAQALYIDPSLWYSGEDEQQSEALGPGEIEPLLFSQQQRIDQQVSKLAPSDPLTPSAFFIGVAGYGEQRVFAQEIRLAASVLGSRYGATARSLLLINDRRSLEEAPLASPTALRYAIGAVAAKMNLHKDVLLLALSSHGARDGSFAMSNSALPLHDLAPADLTSFLKEAGIKWRVIVVSACYSGAFIEPLLGYGTAVIAAAAADRTSFGCADDRDLTYFGEAFYRDALPGAPSLRSAFTRAKETIARREKAEDIDPSKPQAFFGEGIEQQLAALPPSRAHSRPH